MVNRIKQFRNIIVTFLLFSIISILFYSCGAPIEQELKSNPLIITHYLAKARDFLLFAIVLLNFDKKYWINMYSRLYYFHFTLARIKYFFHHNKTKVGTHKKVWELSIDEPKKKFGVELRKRRNECDYNVIENSEKFIRETNKIILSEHRTAFMKQISDIKKYCEERGRNFNNKSNNDILSSIIEEYDLFLELLKSNNEKNDNATSNNDIAKKNFV
jgi:hypothetical protein